MVASEGGYYGTELQGFCGVMQGENLPPNILNVVVYTVVQYCVAVVVEGAGGQDKRGQEG